MIFKQIEIDNFFSFGKGNVITFDSNGIIFIRGVNKDTGGSNGAGKSSIIDAIVWCIFGKTIRGVAADDVVNSEIGHGTRVMIHVDDYVITRYRKHTKEKNKIIIKKNNKNVSLGSSRETTKELQKVFNITYDTFVNSIVLGSNVNVNFLGTDSNDARRSIFENILGLDLFPQYRDNAKDKASVINENIIKCSASISLHENLIDQHMSKKIEIERKRNQFEADRLTKIDYYKNTLDGYKNINVERELAKFEVAKDMKERIKVLDEREKSKKYELEGIDIHLKEMKKLRKYYEQYKNYSITKSYNSWDELDKLLEKITKINEFIATQESTINIHRKNIFKADCDIKSQEKFIGKPCPTCNTILDQDNLKGMVDNLSATIEGEREHIENITHKITKANELKKKLETQKIELTPEFTRSQLAVMEEKLQQASTQEGDYIATEERYKIVKDEMDRTTEELIKVCSSLKQYKLPTETRSYYEGIRDSIVKAETQIEELKKQKNPYDVISFENEINLSKTVIKEQLLTKKTYESDKQYYDFWVDGFGNQGLKIYIFETVIDYFNKRCQFYLDILSNSQFKIKFDKDLSYEIVGTTYKNNSSGERKRVDLAVMMGLFDLLNLRSSSSSNLLILDEVLDSLDEVGVDNVNSLLLEMNKHIPNIYVISHNNNLGEYFPKTITVQKENGVSILC